ncbi:unnamed protein product [Phytophthora fragariaefolia]|uniref:Unnamed protein product n=1 Tax=Phytophthora fragariaefolia TaxID=1490495 RepID=A0A9W6Y329_9STRA|nr:unnamed protein product [Phytophthora fragariaefolia]
MDTNTPEPTTSTSWRIVFQLAGCPTFLHHKVRILWFGTGIIIKHPNVGRRLQCLQCGELGHLLARCTYTDNDLRGLGSIVVTEADIASFEDIAKPFGSLEEIKQRAAVRLQQQHEAEETAEAALKPQPRKTDLTSDVSANGRRQSSPKPVNTEEGSLHQGATPAPKQHPRTT